MGIIEIGLLWEYLKNGLRILLNDKEILSNEFTNIWLLRHLLITWIIINIGTVCQCINNIFCDLTCGADLTIIYKSLTIFTFTTALPYRYDSLTMYYDKYLLYIVWGQWEDSSRYIGPQFPSAYYINVFISFVIMTCTYM